MLLCQPNITKFCLFTDNVRSKTNDDELELNSTIPRAFPRDVDLLLLSFEISRRIAEINNLSRPLSTEFNENKLTNIKGKRIEWKIGEQNKAEKAKKNQVEEHSYIQLCIQGTKSPLNVITTRNHATAEGFKAQA